MSQTMRTTQSNSASHQKPWPGSQGGLQVTAQALYLPQTQQTCHVSVVNSKYPFTWWKYIFIKSKRSDNLKSLMDGIQLGEEVTRCEAQWVRASRWDRVDGTCGLDLHCAQGMRRNEEDWAATLLAGLGVVRSELKWEQQKCQGQSKLVRLVLLEAASLEETPMSFQGRSSSQSRSTATVLFVYNHRSKHRQVLEPQGTWVKLQLNLFFLLSVVCFWNMENLVSIFNTIKPWGSQIFIL